MAADEMATAVRGIQADVLSKLLDEHLPRNVPHEDWDLQGLRESVRKDFATDVDPASWLQADSELDEQTLRERVVAEVAARYQDKSERYGPELMHHLEKDIMLRTLDQHWREHLAAMDYLRQGIHLRSYAQKDYRYEYKREAYELFSNMLERVKFDTASLLMRVEVRSEADLQREEEERQRRLLAKLQAQHSAAQSPLDTADLAQAPGQTSSQATGQIAGQRAGAATASAATGSAAAGIIERKVGRNEPCPCGSGRKYKQCHGALDT
jgi:preprotein translocase subunit SecA